MDDGVSSPAQPADQLLLYAAPTSHTSVGPISKPSDQRPLSYDLDQPSVGSKSPCGMLALDLKGWVNYHFLSGVPC
jgi:hypothetical protein